jgi:probable F420-dependent oxidoreductase
VTTPSSSAAGAGTGPWPAVGVGLPTFGPHASPAAVDRVSVAADRLGFHSISLSERLLLPGAPGRENTYGLPDWPLYDTLETLTWVAARTERIGLRTDVVIALFQQPVVLARRLATLDVLSGGRVAVGLGIGWMPEELEATGVAPAGRGARFEEHLAVLRACWGPDPVHHEGEHYQVPTSRIGPKPVRGTIPLAIGAVARPAVERAARLGDGFSAGFRTWDELGEQLRWYRDAGGTGPIILRAGPAPVDLTGDHDGRAPAPWTEERITDDLARAHDEGIAEVIWDLNIAGYEPTRQLHLLESLAVTLDLPAKPPT